MGLIRISPLKVVEEKTYDKLKRKSEYLSGIDKIKVDAEIEGLKSKFKDRDK